MRKWQITDFYDLDGLRDWMNEWNFIKVEYIVPHKIIGTEYYAAFYRYKRTIGPEEIPSEKERKEALYT